MYKKKKSDIEHLSHFIIKSIESNVSRKQIYLVLRKEGFSYPTIEKYYRKYNELYKSGQKATEFQAKIEKLNELVNNV